MKPIIIKTQKDYMSVKFLLRVNQKMEHLIENGGYGQHVVLELVRWCNHIPVEAYDNWVIDYESQLGG